MKKSKLKVKKTKDREKKVKNKLQKRRDFLQKKSSEEKKIRDANYKSRRRHEPIVNSTTFLEKTNLAETVNMEFVDRNLKHLEDLEKSILEVKAKKFEQLQKQDENESEEELVKKVVLSEDDKE